MGGDESGLSCFFYDESFNLASFAMPDSICFRLLHEMHTALVLDSNRDGVVNGICNHRLEH